MMTPENFTMNAFWMVVTFALAIVLIGGIGLATFFIREKKIKKEMSTPAGGARPQPLRRAHG